MTAACESRINTDNASRRTVAAEAGGEQGEVPTTVQTPSPSSAAAPLPPPPSPSAEDPDPVVPSPGPSPTPGAIVPPVFAITGPAAPTVSFTPTVVWESVPDASSYDVKVSANADCSSPTQSHTGITATSRVLNTLTKGNWHVCVYALIDGTAYAASNTGFAFVILNHDPSLSYSTNANLSGWTGDGSSGSPFTFTVAQGSTNALIEFLLTDQDTGDSPLISCTNKPSWITLTSSPAKLAFAPVAADVTDGVDFSCEASDGSVSTPTIHFKAIVRPTFSVTGPSTPTSSFTPTVAWDAVTNATSYAVQISANSDCSSPTQSYTGVATTSQALTALVKGTWYACVKAAVGTAAFDATSGAYSFVVSDHAPTWSATISNQWVIDGSAYSVSATATDTDTADTIVYSLDTANMTCDNTVSWSPALSIDGSTGAITGTPTSVTDVVNCTIKAVATSGGVPIDQTHTLTVYPPLPSGFTCDSGSITTTCNVSTTKTLSDGAVLAGPGNLVLQASGNITASAMQSISIKMAGNVTIQASGKISANLTLLSATNIDIQTSGSIDLDGKGHPGGAATASGSGSAGGAGSSTQGGGGGSHGGLGSAGLPGAAAGGATYGSVSAPTSFGSGGGGGAVGAGGAGGGAAKIMASGTLTVAGTIRAYGSAGGSGAGSGGGGAGGSIWLLADVANISGYIYSNGGSGGQTASAGGGGGGGRIALNANVVSMATSTNIQAFAGLGAAVGTYHTAIGNICDSGTLNDTCTISSTKVLGDYLTITGTGSLVLASGARIKTSNVAPVTISIAMGNDVVIENGGQITANISLATAKNFTIDTGATIDLRSYGYPGSGGKSNGQGPGAGNGSTATTRGGSGAAHGGVGGNAVGGVAGSTTTYGDKLAPVAFGSSGGGSQAFGGGKGGGIAKLEVTETLTVNGSIVADGGMGASESGSAAGGGSGGSIWLIADTIAGAGSIQAHGGYGGWSFSSGYNGGGGGAGRIAIEAVNNNFTGGTGATKVIGGGAYSGATQGGAGTYCWNGAGC